VVRYAVNDVPVTLLMTRHNDEARPDRREASQYLSLADRLLDEFAPEQLIACHGHSMILEAMARARGITTAFAVRGFGCLPEMRRHRHRDCDDRLEWVLRIPDLTTTFNKSNPITLSVVIPTGTQVSPPGVDSVGQSNGSGLSVISGLFVGMNGLNFAFTPKPTSPSTRTPGYWKNDPDAWPVSSIAIGPNIYTEAQAIAWLSSTGKDKSVTMVQSYVAAYLSIKIGNDGSCVSQTLRDAYNSLVTYPVGSGVADRSAAWAVGQPTQSTLDAYDNGLRCAPHRK
jgi:hypothetical protein